MTDTAKIHNHDDGLCVLNISLGMTGVVSLTTYTSNAIGINVHSPSDSLLRSLRDAATAELLRRAALTEVKA